MTNLTARSLSLVEAGTGRGVSVDITGFPYVLVWSVKGPVQFVCIEPWHGLPDAANATGEWLEKPATVRSSVVFPAPLAPRRAKISPCLTEKVRPFNTL